MLGCEACGDNIELLDGVWADVIGQSADHKIVVFEAINVDVGLPSPSARNADVTDSLFSRINDGRAHNLGNQGGKIGEIARLEWERIEFLSLDDLSDL